MIGPFGVEGVGKITSLSKPYPEFLGMKKNCISSFKIQV